MNIEWADKIAPKAAVVGASIVICDDAMSAQDREDVYLSHLHSQYVTRLALLDGLAGDWFDYYMNTLKYLGCDIAVPAGAGNGAGDMAGHTTFEQMNQVFDEKFAVPARQALEALKRKKSALDALDIASVSGDSRFFQVMPCIAKGNGKIEIALYHKRFTTTRKVSRLLFLKREEIMENSVEIMALITFNTRHYATFRDKVAASVAKHAMLSIQELDL